MTVVAGHFFGGYVDDQHKTGDRLGPALHTASPPLEFVTGDSLPFEGPAVVARGRNSGYYYILGRCRSPMAKPSLALECPPHGGTGVAQTLLEMRWVTRILVAEARL